MRGIVAVVAVSAALLLPAAPAAAQESPTVDGAGSTWSQIAVDQWRADVARQGLKINYQGVGSTAGRAFYIQDQVDFAVSEIPFLAEEKPNADRKPFTYLPIVAGGTAFMYNLLDAAGQRVTNLRLSPNTIAGIFTGRIRTWADPAITADNGRAFPDTPVTPVLRSDGSGTSAQFTAWMAEVTPGPWGEFARSKGLPAASTSFYPEFPEAGSKAQSGSDGVANYVASDSIGRGSINYVEYGYALQRSFPVASVLNSAGYFVQPTAENVAVALTRARINPDRTQVLGDVYRNPDPRTYPVSSYSYMIVPTAGFDAAKGAVLGQFILYFLCAGQQKAKLLGYSPLPQVLVQYGFEAVREVPGAPAPPPIEQCANPTITGGFTTSAAPLPPPSAAQVATPAAPAAAPSPRPTTMPRPPARRRRPGRRWTRPMTRTTCKSGRWRSHCTRRRRSRSMLRPARRRGARSPRSPSSSACCSDRSCSGREFVLHSRCGRAGAASWTPRRRSFRPWTPSPPCPPATWSATTRSTCATSAATGPPTTARCDGGRCSAPTGSIA